MSASRCKSRSESKFKFARMFASQTKPQITGGAPIPSLSLCPSRDLGVSLDMSLSSSLRVSLSLRLCPESKFRTMLGI